MNITLLFYLCVKTNQVLVNERILMLQISMSVVLNHLNEFLIDFVYLFINFIVSSITSYLDIYYKVKHIAIFYSLYILACLYECFVFHQIIQTRCNLFKPNTLKRYINNFILNTENLDRTLIIII